MFLTNVIFAAPLGTIVDLYRKQHCKTVSLDKYENKGTCFGFGVIHADRYIWHIYFWARYIGTQISFNFCQKKKHGNNSA